MNAVAEEVHKHRSTDGVTVIKILLGVISALIMSFMMNYEELRTLRLTLIYGSLVSV